MIPHAHEVNFDGLIGPTHNYAGLSPGNLASQRYRHNVSNPRRAALQGLAKMKLLHDLGLQQAVLPPQERPDLDLLRRAGFRGTDTEVVQQAQVESPELLATGYSASSMWAANAATVCPSADSVDGRVHFTPANLISELHRSLEPTPTAEVLRQVFDDEQFVHHEPLPPAWPLRDEGAANHVRLAAAHGEAGVQMFVYGARALEPAWPAPSRHIARQSYEASAAVARLNRVEPTRLVFAQQHPDAIDAGVFHNDVICVGHLDVLFYHAGAFANTPDTVHRLRDVFERRCGARLRTLEVQRDELSVAEAVSSYLFNSQLVRLPDGTTALICPEECREHERVRTCLDRLVSGNGPIGQVHFVDLRESMHNGGGPACLRLRVALTDAELARIHGGVRLTDDLYDQLTTWVERHYRDKLRPNDLADPALIDESRTALDELTQLLSLGPIYPFQRL